MTVNKRPDELIRLLRPEFMSGAAVAARYLLLDASNDPVTGQLAIHPNTAYRTEPRYQRLTIGEAAGTSPGIHMISGVGGTAADFVYTTTYTAGTNVDDGGPAWSNPNNARLPEPSHASASGTAPNGTYITDTLNIAINAGASLPANALITGITVTLSRYRTNNTATVVDSVVMIRLGGVYVGYNQANASFWKYNTPAESVTYGGDGDTWGSGITAADIIAGNVSVGLKAQIYWPPSGVAGISGLVSSFLITVHYVTEPQWTLGVYESDSTFTISPGPYVSNGFLQLTTGGRLIVPAPQGTSPLGIASTTLVSNLNADYLDGLHGSSYALVGHNILSASHGDVTAAAVVRGDLIMGMGASPKWERHAISVPAAGFMNYLGAANGDVEPGYKALFDATVPGTISEGASAATGSATVAARRDHTHGAPATWAATAHNLLSAIHGDTLADTVVRGDVIVGNATPKWSRLALGGVAGSALVRDATDVGWSAAAVAQGTGAANRVAYWSGTNTIQGSANFTFDGTRIGIGIASSSSYLLNALAQYTNPSAEADCLNFANRLTITSANSEYAYGIIGYSRIEAGSSANYTGHIYGGNFNSQINSTSAITVSNATGVNGFVQIGASSQAQITRATGIRASIVNASTAGATITLGIALRIDPPVTTGAIGTLYGIYVDSQSGATNNYAIYTNAGLNRFGDQLAIAGSADRQQLIVTGHTTQATTTAMAQITRDDSAAGISAMLGLTALGSGAAGDGGSIVMQGKSSTTAAQPMSYFEWLWTTATHATRTSRLDVYNVVSGIKTLQATIGAGGVTSNTIFHPFLLGGM